MSSLESLSIEDEVIGHYINGKEIADEGQTQDVYNPATGQISKRVSMASMNTIKSAISAAELAFPTWNSTPPFKRTRIMFRFKELLEQHEITIAKMITSEHGKVFSDALGEFRRGVEVVEYACAAPELLKGEYSKNAGPAIDTWSEFQPLGVVAGITPFNFPAMVPMWMYPMAIICGNTFILKPSEKDPSVSLYIANLFTEAGLPDGVFNVINGAKEAVDTLLADKRIQAISFVGSTSIAEYVYQTGATVGKRIQALGGAKNHALVMPDADIDNVASALAGAAYGSCGERCMAISVAVCVGNQVADELVAKLSNIVSRLKIGPGTDADNEMGPLISKAHLEKVRSYIDSGVKEGASLVVDGRDLCVPGHEQGFFLGGCLFDDVKPNMSIYTDEIFGPVLCIVRTENIQEAMKLIDDHEYGNGACIFTQDGGVARYFSDNVRTGMVGVNVPIPTPVACHSFGGWKRSLFGDLGAYGPDSIRFYTRRKTITQRWPKASQEKTQFSFPSHS